MLLSSIKAVGPGYPLRGEVRISDEPHGSERTATAIPEPGTVWVEARLLSQLDMQVGDLLEVGYAQLRVAAVLTHEPDHAGDFYSLTPRVLMNLGDLPATRVIQPGSRVRYRLLVSGEEADLQRLRSWLEPRLESHQRITSVADDNRQIGSALTRANQFLGLARSEEHTSELQSRPHLVCRLLLEKKNQFKSQ